MFKAIKKILFPSRIFLKSIRNESEIQRRLIGDLLAVSRKMEIQNSQTFKNHLTRIFDSEMPSEIELSYSFRFTAAGLNPEIHESTPSKIAVCTLAFGDGYRNSIRDCLESQYEYCKKKQYTYVDLKVPPSRLLRHPSWYKIPLIYHLLLLGYKRFAFIDGDALITKPEISIEPFFERLELSGKDLAIANDEAGLNMGVFFAKASPSLPRLLDLIWMYNCDRDHVNWEQQSLRTLIDDFYTLEKKVLVIPNANDCNSFPKERAEIHKLNGQPNTWKPGDFICHFSGIRPPLLEKLVSSYMEQARGVK